MTKRNKIIIASAIAAVIIIIAAAVTYKLSSSTKSAGTSNTTTTTSASSNSTSSSTSSSTTAPAIQAPAGTPLPSGFEPESASFVSSNVGFALGVASCSSGSCLTIARTQDGGKTWLAIPAPSAQLAQGPLLTTNSSAVSRIRFVNILDGYVYGPNLYTTHDGGATWKQVTLAGAPTSYGVSSVETNGNYTYLVAGNPNTAVPAPDVLYRSPASTDNFTLQPQPTFSTGWAVRVIANPYGVLVATGDQKGDFYFQANGTNTWTHVNPNCNNGVPTNPLAALASPANGSAYPQLVVACGGNAGAGSQQKTIVKSANLASFTNAPSNPPLAGNLSAVASPDGNTIAVAAASGATYLYVSTNGGASWITVISTPAYGGAPIHDLGFTNNTQGFAIEGNATKAGTSSSSFIMTHNGGVSWQNVTF